MERKGCCRGWSLILMIYVSVVFGALTRDGMSVACSDVCWFARLYDLERMISTASSDAGTSTYKTYHHDHLLSHLASFLQIMKSYIKKLIEQKISGKIRLNVQNSISYS